MWGFLATSHAPITDNENSENKPYFCLGLLSNLADILRPVDAILIVLGLVYPFSPSRDGISLGALDEYWEKQDLFKFDVFWTPSEYEILITSGIGAPLLAVLSCTWDTDCDNVSVLLLLSGAKLGSWLGVSLGYSLRSGANQVSLR